MIRILVPALVVLTAWSCTPPCDPIPSNLQGLCHRADAGPMIPDASFVLEGSTFSQGNCEITIDGGQIFLQTSGASTSCGSPGSSGVRAASEVVKCTIPPLAPGTYSVDSQPAVTFTLPAASADAGVRTCL